VTSLALTRSSTANTSRIARLAPTSSPNRRAWLGTTSSGLGLGLDPNRAAAEPQRRARGHHRALEPRALEPRAVGRAQIAHGEAAVDDGHLGVPRRHPVVGQRQPGVGGGADHHRGAAQPARAPAIGPVDHHQLAAEPTDGTVERLAEHRRDTVGRHLASIYA
jgi:hypothetical protein